MQGTSAEAARTSTRRGIAKYDAKELDFGMEDKLQEGRGCREQRRGADRGGGGDQGCEPLRHEAQRLHPRWPSVAACALVCTTPPSSISIHEAACVLLAAAAQVSVRRRPAHGQYKSQEGHHRRQDEREGRLGEGHDAGARQRQLRHRHPGGAVRGTDAASMDGDPNYIYIALLSFSYL